jgi:hypothetical protein
MAGALTIDTLNAGSGVFATQNGMTGIAKAYLVYNGVAQTITSSFNVSSVTYNATGNYTVNLTTAMPNANYSVVGSVGSTTASGMWFTTGGTINSFTLNNTTTSFRVATYYATNNLANAESVCCAVFSS